MTKPFVESRKRFPDFDTLVASEEDMFVSVSEWLADGWNLPDENPTPEQAAAALLMEARTQDSCVERGESSPEYPVYLRNLAVYCIKAAGHKI